MEEKGEKRPHSCFLQNRSQAAVTGVCDVLLFDENQVIMDTDLGLATLKGKNLHVSRLTLEKGEVDIEGQIDSLIYSPNDAYRKSAQTFLSRLFG